ncbi:acyltransferase domain-containing protein [Paenibacillus sp. F411]|uniref:type I polyketide synthase n=1 Tax=Paenibacillus sp. F411 TaxID=2820239 RepID=UPI001AAE2A77|nr:type I polyketide synthase [Paenibacillus sp. F411]MBO2945611.1 acyltransferase domain-containing protein [Paenibacillus sp. F411]
MQEMNGTEIAVVGMNCRFPGASNVEAFWSNLVEGTESIVFFSDEELEQAGVKKDVYKRPNYVRAGSIIEDTDQFDAAFFGMTPREAEILDPQQRLFLEKGWEALELAGYTPEKYSGRIGVFAGVFSSSYLFQLYSEPGLVDSVGELAIRHGNEKDYLATRMSYKLNLKGPSVSVQTSCSTSLVAVHFAVQSLLGGECDMALAGGVSIVAQQKTGYLHQEGDVLASDGHCRPFDVKASGTIFGNGVGVVVLKRLEDALQEGDTVYAVIKGTAINNDGSDKVSFTAPSVNGQAEVILDAQAMAGVLPSTIGMIEAHGTGTPLGDPIEIAALSRVFRMDTEQKGFCAIGSVKSNIGHLGAASGVAGLIKTVLSLHHGVIPPSLHFEQPNPNIDFAQSPFVVNTKARTWEQPEGFPRRAGVSSFGMGGTNAHVVLEESPAVKAAVGVAPAAELLVLSALSEDALEQAADQLQQHLEQHPDLSLADVAFTLQEGRKEFPYRMAFSAGSMAETAELLKQRSGKLHARHAAAPKRLGFLFPGQGSQYIGMVRGLYESEPVFREAVDTCCERLQPRLGLDLRTLWWNEQDADAASRLQETSVAQPSLFIVQYAMAKQLEAWGLTPACMLGHSIGEYTAACLAGVFTLEDALELVAERGRLMQSMPPGVMMSVHLPESKTREHLFGSLSVAAVNAPEITVVAGNKEDMERLRDELRQEGIEAYLLHTSHAFHSSMMDPVIEPFTATVSRITLHAPQIPYISNVTGSWIQPEQVMDPGYWGEHVRQSVRFAEGASALMSDPGLLLVEIGPSHVLSGLMSQQGPQTRTPSAVPLIRHPKDRQEDRGFLLQALGRLWCEGVAVKWSDVHPDRIARRIALPTYPFQRKRYWIGQGSLSFLQSGQEVASATAADSSASSYPTDKGEVDSATGVTEPSAPAAAAALDKSPEGVLEEVRGIWEDLFGISPIGLDDDFFTLGGNSMLAIQLMTRIRNAYDIELQLENMFDEPTIRGLARQVIEALPDAKGSPEEEAAELEALLKELEGQSLDDIQRELDKLKAEGVKQS